MKTEEVTKPISPRRSFGVLVEVKKKLGETWIQIRMVSKLLNLTKLGSFQSNFFKVEILTKIWISKKFIVNLSRQGKGSRQ